jgi:hypothetical protein
MLCGALLQLNPCFTHRSRTPLLDLSAAKPSAHSHAVAAVFGTLFGTRQAV